MSRTRTQAYDDATYWDRRYSEEAEPFDWYQSYLGLQLLLNHCVQKSADGILMIGCGNSTLSEDMVKDGYGLITNVDISDVCIQKMQKDYSGQEDKLRFLQMDCCDMAAFGSATFDAVVDKGTLDALMCGDGAFVNVGKMLMEISRVLRPGGVYFLVTYGEPETRLPVIDVPGYGWKVNLHLLGRPGTERAKEGGPWVQSLEPVPLAEDLSFPPELGIDDMDFHFVYACRKEKP